MSEQTRSEPLARQHRGEPSKATLAARALAEQQGNAREVVRERRHVLAGDRIQVTGRDGEVLSRQHSVSGDPFHIDQAIVPAGWSYQWNVHTVAGKEMTEMEYLMYSNGWRPVPAERHDGMFMPRGAKGQILRGGQRLEERPLELTLEAQREDKERALGQIRDQNALLTNNRLGAGFDERYYAGNSRNQGRVPARQGIDPAIDAPRPNLEIDPG